MEARGGFLLNFLFDDVNSSATQHCVRCVVLFATTIPHSPQIIRVIRRVLSQSRLDRLVDFPLHEDEFIQELSRMHTHYLYQQNADEFAVRFHTSSLIVCTGCFTWRCTDDVETSPARPENELDGSILPKTALPACGRWRKERQEG